MYRSEQDIASSNMAFARTIFAVLITVAVAILPAAGWAAFKLPGADSAEMSIGEPMAGEPMDCFPHESNPCDKSMQDCPFMAACVLKCFNFWAPSFMHLAPPGTDLAAVSLPTTAELSARAVGPPFRPPRS